MHAFFKFYYNFLEWVFKKMLLYGFWNWICQHHSDRIRFNVMIDCTNVKFCNVLRVCFTCKSFIDVWIIVVYNNVINQLVCNMSNKLYKKLYSRFTCIRKLKPAFPVCCFLVILYNPSIVLTTHFHLFAFRFSLRSHWSVLFFHFGRRANEKSTPWKV